MKSDSPFDIQSWLESLGLGEYADGFQAQAVTRETLLELTPDDLKECGVVALGHRKILAAAIEALRAEQTAVVEPPGDQSGTVSEGHDHLIPEATAQPAAHAAEMQPADEEALASPAGPPGRLDDKEPEEKPSFFQRIRTAYRKASGDSMLLSIVIHAIILLIGTYLVVSQIVEERKISFGGGEAGPKAEVQHKVKMRTTTAPAPTKRITTTSSVAKVALPDMPDVPTNMGPSIAGAMGAGGFGAAGGLGGGGGGGGGGSGGGKGNGFSKITFFGLQGSKATDGLVGTFYDLKQKQSGKPTEFALVPGEEGSAMVSNPANGAYCQFVREFCKTWSSARLNGFFKAEQKLVIYQFAIPMMTADGGPAAFGVEKECKPRRWLALYEGTVIPPRDGRFRFRGRGDDVLVVRWNGQMVLDGCYFGVDASVNTDPEANKIKGPGGKWINMKKGVPAKMQVLIGECPGGGFFAWLCLEEEGVQYPDGYPLFQLKAAPVPTGVVPFAKEPMVFSVQPAKTGYGSMLP